MTTQTPIPDYSSGGGGGGASARVNGPGIALMILGGLYVLGNLLGVILGFIGVLGAAAGANGDMNAEARMNGTVGGVAMLIGAILGFIFGFVIAFGGMKMRKLQGYGLAITAAVLSMLPCSCCFVAGLPIGIWALVVLMSPEVKAAFR